ncbi:MAG: hypothetical protein J5I93_01560 [Pirellulaceae bacterium]|nr:hypothetical protein [Pirellulaceae bacterium]
MLCRTSAVSILVAMVVVVGWAEVGAAQDNPDFPGHLGVYVAPRFGGMEIQGFIPNTPASRMARTADLRRGDVILELDGSATPSMRRLLAARDGVPIGAEARMVLRSPRGEVYHVWIGRSQGAPAGGGMEYRTGGPGDGRENGNRRKSR